MGMRSGWRGAPFVDSTYGIWGGGSGERGRSNRTITTWSATRRTHSNRRSTRRRWWFGKATAAWTFTKVTGERRWLTCGKLRLAYGEAGNEPPPYVTSLTYFSQIFGGIAQGTGETPTQNGFGGLLTGGQKPADVLRPERSKELEAGVDLGLLQDRADAQITYYNSKTVDVILPTPLATSTGYSFH